MPASRLGLAPTIGGMRPHILILSVSAGAGHVRAAQALEAAAKSSNPPLDATHLDLLTLVPKEFRKLYAEQYIKLVEKLPQLWSWLYSKSDRPSRDSIKRRICLRLTALSGPPPRLKARPATCPIFRQAVR